METTNAARGARHPRTWSRLVTWYLREAITCFWRAVLALCGAARPTARMSRGPRHAVVEAKLPVTQVEIRPGRTIAVHHHLPSSQAAPTAVPRARLFFVHGSCGSMLQYEPLVGHHTGIELRTSRQGPRQACYSHV